MPLALHSSVASILEATKATLVAGSSELVLANLADPRTATRQDLAILNPDSPLSWRKMCQAGAVICSDVSQFDGLDCPVLLLHPAPRLALLGLLQGPCAFHALEADSWLEVEEVVAIWGLQARTAMIHCSASIAEGVAIAPGVVVHARVSIAEGSHIGAGTVLGAPGFGLVEVNGELVQLPHLAGVEIGRNAMIGAQCNVAAGLLDPTRIGEGCRLDAQIQVGHNVQLGMNCVVAAQVGFSGSVRLGRNCLVGGQAGFADHVDLGDGCIVAARAGVTRSWPGGTQLGGFPARPLAEWRRSVARSRKD